MAGRLSRSGFVTHPLDDPCAPGADNHAAARRQLRRFFAFRLNRDYIVLWNQKDPENEDFDAEESREVADGDHPGRNGERAVA